LLILKKNGIHFVQLHEVPEIWVFTSLIIGLGELGKAILFETLLSIM